MLRNQVLINQSGYNISDEEIEALCLGLNFIPSDTSPETMETNSNNLNQGVSKLIRAINISLHFGDNSNTTTKKGRLTKSLPNTWEPPTQSWTQIPAVIDILDNIRRVPNGTDPVGTPIPIKRAIEKLQSETNLHILKADKGRNTVIWETDAYDREATRQLSDTTTYTELTLSEYHSHLKRIHCLCETLSENLLANGHITTTEDEAICSTEARGAYIYFLPKTHKDMNKTSLTFPGRPIVATFTSGTYLLDKLITEVTAPLLPRIPGSLVDTSDLVEKLPKQKLPEGTLITTMDVNSLYPNIPWGPGIEAATSFYTNNLELLQQIAVQNSLLRPPHPALFKRILTTVLCNSIINFKDIRFFHQVKGTAMGCCISVFFANCYMFHLTQQVIERPPGWLITFLRFIDDILIISNHTEPNSLPDLIGSITTEHITYTHTQPSQSDNFLDVTIRLKSSTNTLEISPYTKETASGAYLHPASNHPGHVISAIPYAQFLRLRRNSSTIDIFEKHARKMMTDFKNMTYDKKLLVRSYSKALCGNPTLMNTNRQTNNSVFRLITTFNKYNNWKLKSRQLKSLYNIILNHYRENGPFQNWKHVRVLQAKQPTIVFTNGPSIDSGFSGQIKRPRETHSSRTEVNVGLGSTQYDTSQPGGSYPGLHSPNTTLEFTDANQQHIRPGSTNQSRLGGSHRRNPTRRHQLQHDTKDTRPRTGIQTRKPRLEQHLPSTERKNP